VVLAGVIPHHSNLLVHIMSLTQQNCNTQKSTQIFSAFGEPLGPTHNNAWYTNHTANGVRT
jgi:hypothetical protein